MGSSIPYYLFQVEEFNRIGYLCGGKFTVDPNFNLVLIPICAGERLSPSTSPLVCQTGAGNPESEEQVFRGRRRQRVGAYRSMIYFHFPVGLYYIMLPYYQHRINLSRSLGLRA